MTFIAESMKSRSRTTSRSTSPRRSPHQNHITLTPINRRQEQVSRSRWQQLVVGAGSAAGTTVAVVSEESMRCLKYCLSWLQVNYIFIFFSCDSFIFWSHHPEN
jgi:Transcription factor Opi1